MPLYDITLVTGTTFGCASVKSVPTEDAFIVDYISASGHSSKVVVPTKHIDKVVDEFNNTVDITQLMGDD